MEEREKGKRRKIRLTVKGNRTVEGSRKRVKLSGSSEPAVSPGEKGEGV